MKFSSRSDFRDAEVRIPLPQAESLGEFRFRNAEVRIRAPTGQSVSNAYGIGSRSKCHESEVTYYRWGRQEYGGLKADQVKRLKQLEQENSRLRRAVSDLTLDKLILQEAARGNF